MFGERRMTWDKDAQAASGRRFRDLDVLIEYRQYEGARGHSFEQQWLKPRLASLGYTHVRFLGGERCEEDGSFSGRVCEIRKAGAAVEFFTYE